MTGMYLAILVLRRVSVIVGGNTVGGLRLDASYAVGAGASELPISFGPSTDPWQDPTEPAGGKPTGPVGMHVAGGAGRSHRHPATWCQTRLAFAASRILTTGYDMKARREAA